MDHSEWTTTVLNHVADIGEDRYSLVEYIRKHKVRLGFLKQGAATGAMWFVNGNIYLNPRFYSLQTSPDDPFLLNLIAHEVRHLQQGVFTALSVYGELDAWQTGFRVFYHLTGHYPFDSSGQPHPALVEIMSLPVSWDRAVLKRTRVLMQEYAGKGYRVDLLPLYPLQRKIGFWLTGNQPNNT